MASLHPRTVLYVALAGAALLLTGVLAVRLTGVVPGGPADLGGQPGRALMGDLGCMSCHSVAGQGGNLGPTLGSELAARGEDALFAYLTDPENVNVYPGNGHAAFTRIDGDDARRIARYLASLSVTGAYKGPAPP